MDEIGLGVAGRFCWLDLAATDAGRAKAFYADAFGWACRERRANGGEFTVLVAGGRGVASLYQLRRAQVATGVPSHWTPYVRVDGAEAAAGRIIACGGAVVVPPFVVDGTARIALVQDAVGALLGLWEPLEAGGSDGDV